MVLFIVCLGPLVRLNEHAVEAFENLIIIHERVTIYESNISKLLLNRAYLVKISLLSFPEYQVERSGVFFKDRDYYLQFKKALKLEYQILEHVQLKEWAQAIELASPCQDLWWSLLKDAEKVDKDPFLRRYEPGWIYTRIMEHFCESLQKVKEYARANVVLTNLINQRIYRQRNCDKWFKRLSLNQAIYLKEVKMALKTCLDALKDERVHICKLLLLGQ